MRNIILGIFILFPIFTFSQSNIYINDDQRFEINNLIRECLEDYKDHVKCKPRDINDFYNLFTENESIVNDILPSKNFSENVNVFEWDSIIKGVQLYSVETEILKWESYNPITIDSGYVSVIVNKEVFSSRWSKYTRKDYNITIIDKDKEIDEQVSYSSNEDLRFEFHYNLNPPDIACKIRSISKIDDLTRKNIYLVYYKPSYLFSTKNLIDKKLIESYNDNDLISFEIKGDKIQYILAEEKNIESYVIGGLKSPKIENFKNLDGKNQLLKKITYREKTPIRLSYLILTTNRSSIFEYGNSFVPDNIDYGENIHFSISTDLFKLNEKIKITIKGNMINSNTIINNDYIEKSSVLPNPITNNQTNYIRKNSITNFYEDLSFNQRFVIPTAIYEYNQKLNFYLGLSIYSNTTIKSSRNGLASYSGIFEDNFNIEINEPIEYVIDGNVNVLDLGIESFSIQENINIQNTVSFYEIGANYQFLNGFKFNLLYRINQENLFTKTKTEISSNRNEFNSFVEVADFFKPSDKLYLGLTLELKL